MSITLSTGLWNALESKRHHPIAKIISSQLTSEFPLIGTQLRLGAVVEVQPQMFVHSSGRLISFWIEGGSLMMAYSDIERTTWTVTVPYGSTWGGISAVDFAAIELSNGTIGIVWMLGNTGSYMGMWGTTKITETGAYVTASTRYVVSSTQTSPKLYPSICRTSTGFLLTYEEIVNPGGGYYIRRQTLDDPTFMGAWSAISTITLNYPLVDTVPKGYPNVARYESGQIILVFDYRYDYQETRYKQDLYYCLSNNDGVTFSTPAKFTNYNSYSEGAEAPNTAFCPDGNLIVSFHKKAAVINLRSTVTTGWNCNNPNYPYSPCNGVRDIHFDSASGLLFVVVGGDDQTMCALVIDPETFQIIKYYNAVDSSPKFNIAFAESSTNVARSGYAGEGQYMVFGGAGSSGICLINHQTETITEYWFADVNQGITKKNIDIKLVEASMGVGDCSGFKLDIEAGRLYLFFYNGYFWHPQNMYGYIDITEQADTVTGMYTWHLLNHWPSSHQMIYTWFRAFKNEGYALAGWNCTQLTNVLGLSGELIVLDYENGTVIKTYTPSSNAGFFYGGGTGAVIKDNKIYLGIQYLATYGQEDRRGLCIIDLLTDTMTYERPTYATYDDYRLLQPILIENDTKILWAAWGGSGGLVEYDIATHTWRRFDGETNPGLSAAANFAAYDNTNNIIFQGNYGGGGIYIYTPSGSFYTTEYMTGEPGSPYTWGPIAQLSYGPYNQLPATICDDRTYAFWLHEDPDTGYNYLNWSQSGLTEDVSGDLVKDQSLTIEWEVDRPARARFTLARGHLYDPTNVMSFYSGYLKKHRMVTIELGELSNGVEYFSPQGKFIVTGVELRLTKTSHPTITVTCEDRSTMWDEVIVTATQNYGGTSLAVIMTDLLEDVANLQSSDFLVTGAFTPNLHMLYSQWVDESLYDIIDQLSNHFGIFPYWNHSGVFTFKAFNLAAAVSHRYTNSENPLTQPAQFYSKWAKITEWSPQDSNMSYINRVTVKAESHVTHEVIYPEERVCSMNGTCGWWGGHRDKIIWYSDDRTRTMRYPRLEVISSVKESTPYAKLIHIGGGAEYISDTDINELWCEVTIEQPDMLMYVFGLSILFLHWATACIFCDFYVVGWCWVFIMLMNLALSQLIAILTGVASYEYEIWARPLGKVKQMVQATANDEDFQRDMGGQIIEHAFDDALAFNVEHCQMVADHEIAIVHAQRNRVTLKKICHLKDELGDIVEFPHPINNQYIKLFIAKLTRTFTYGDQGEFTDGLEGWIV